MAGEAFAVDGPAVDDAESSRARLRLRQPFLVQVVRYALVGGLGTGANAVIFLVLRIWWDAVPANLLAIVLSTALSTEVNRRFTFGDAEAHRWRTHVQNGGTILFYAFYSSAVLLLLDMVVDDPSAPLQSATVAAASLLGGTVRFLVLRYWVFDTQDDDVPHAELITRPAAEPEVRRAIGPTTGGR